MAPRMPRQRKNTPVERAGLDAITRRRLATYLLATGGLVGLAQDAGSQSMIYTETFNVDKGYGGKLSHVEESGLVDGILSYDFHIRAFSFDSASAMTTSIDARAIDGGLYGDVEEEYLWKKRLVTPLQTGDTVGATGADTLPVGERGYLMFSRITTYCNEFGECSRNDWSWGNFDGGQTFVGYFMGDDPSDADSFGAISVGFTSFPDSHYRVYVDYLNASADSFAIPACTSCDETARSDRRGSELAQAPTSPSAEPGDGHERIPLAVLSGGASATVAWRRRSLTKPPTPKS